MTTAWYARLNHAERHVWLVPLILSTAIGQMPAILKEIRVEVRIDCSSSTAQIGLEKK